MSLCHWQGRGVAAWLPLNSSGLFYIYCVCFSINYPINKKESKDWIRWATPKGSAPIMQLPRSNHEAFGPEAKKEEEHRVEITESHVLALGTRSVKHET